MDFLSILSLLIASPLLVVALILFIPIVKVLFAKFVNNHGYAPVEGTIFGLLGHLDYLHDYQTQVAKRLPTFRFIGLTHSEISTADTRNVEHILKTSFTKYAKGKHLQENVSDLWGDGIFAADGDKWLQQRKLASYEFSTRVLRDFSCSVFRKNAANLATTISKNAMSGQVIEFQDLFMKTTLESIFKVGFGIDLHCLDWLSNEEASNFCKAFDDANDAVNLRFIDPLWKLKRFLNIGCEATLKKNIKIVDKFIYNIISTKKELLAAKSDHNEKEDILSRFLAESEENPEAMSTRYLRDIILNFLIAGKDTTANTLCWFFYMLCKNPLIQEKVAQEVIDITFSRPDDANFVDFAATLTDATLDKMHYLHAALTETLRLYPAVPWDGRCAQEDDILPDGHKVKKGDEVYYLSYAMGRMPYIWGEDAEEFRPERWLKDGVFQPESSFKFISFHAGPRICLGKDFAFRQMKILSIVLIRYFRFKLSDIAEDAAYKVTFTLHMKRGLHVCAVPRKN
ncbi:cytochrome P450, family 704, subfamily A, polypeptide 2 [Hibiscus trionum]|uniref:Cytochrome P450, family 704, subfamily A, polypeptide 2 n=1 Tax=Hibiscus trionum TaxID=183268 RepID=A0A9W7MF08_HIBTR|nr:cytochrome P450, family 704, subfamily A, polypeptide 2 [Hibiscus trionum]